jgi:hypothetical protein
MTGRQGERKTVEILPTLVIPGRTRQCVKHTHLYTYIQLKHTGSTVCTGTYVLNPLKVHFMRTSPKENSGNCNATLCRLDWKRSLI